MPGLLFGRYRLFCLLACAGWLLSCHTAGAESSASATAAPPLTRSIEVVPRFESMRVLRYPDTLDAFDFRKRFEKESPVSAADAGDFVRLLEKNRQFSPEYRKRCLPVWDYGLEFQDRAKQPGRLVLFSFRCATLRIVEVKDSEPLFRDFSPERAEFYDLFRRLLGPNVYMEDDLLREKQDDASEIDLEPTRPGSELDYIQEFER